MGEGTRTVKWGVEGKGRDRRRPRGGSGNFVLIGSDLLISCRDLSIYPGGRG